MNGWVTVPANEFCASVRDGTHDSPKRTTSGQKLITSRHMIGGDLLIDEAYLISNDDYLDINRRSKVDQWDVLISMIGTVGGVFLVKEEPNFAIKNIGLFKSMSELRGRWLYYYLLSSMAQQEITSRLRGTTQLYISLGELRALPIRAPYDEAEMREITAILSALDDKIELNRKMAATLEEMARALYRSWFVDFDPVRARAEGRTPAHMDAATAALFPDSFGEDGLPVGWEIVETQKEINVVIGKTPPRKEPEHFVGPHGGMRWLSIRDMGSCGVFTEKTAEGLMPEAVKKFNIAVAPRGTVLLSFKLTVGRIAIASDNICTNEAIAHMNIKSYSYIGRYFLYSALKAFDFDMLASTSSIATAVNSKTIKKMPLIMPSCSAVEAFEFAVQPWFNKILALTQENHTLTTLRDTLLPRLMSGEIRVGAARKLVEEVV